jgi:RNA polymerase sigma factor (TIGR02999 family)
LDAKLPDDVSLPGHEMTRLLGLLARHEPQAADQLLPLVYDELRKLAATRLAREAPGQTLQATALVHEAYLRMAGSHPGQPWEGRGHFFAAAAEAMRRILVERARQRAAVRHGGQRRKVELGDPVAPVHDRPDQVLAIDEALIELEAHDEAAARLVKLRYFVGMTHQEAAESLDLTRRQADRLWALARAWLFKRLQEF